MTNAIETLRSMTLPGLTGTPKQVAFASRIRAGWLAAQLETIALELKIIAGEAVAGVDLVEGVDPKCEELRDGFVGIVHGRIEGLKALMGSRVSSKTWIESREGRWVLDFGPMKRR